MFLTLADHEQARYPALDYTIKPHRMRLGRFKHHKRLFDAFDSLELTYGEIQDFCCWEGTKWARERYEKDEGIKVVDTTGDGIGPFVDRRERVDHNPRRHSITRKTDISIVFERQSRIDEDAEHLIHDSDHQSDHEMRDGERDSELREFSADNGGDGQDEQEITQNIIAAWERGQSLSPEFEQYLKEQSESGRHPELVARLMAQHQGYAPADTATMITSA